MQSTCMLLSFYNSYQTLLVRLSTKDEKLNYKPGDHVAIFPANRSEVVDALIDIIYDKPEAEKLLTIETCIENRGKYELLLKFKYHIYVEFLLDAVNVFSKDVAECNFYCLKLRKSSRNKLIQSLKKI